MSEVITNGVNNTQAEGKTTAQVIMEAGEKVLRAKYSRLNIIPGSLIQEPNHPVYGNKRRVKVVCGCNGCTEVVERATSDLHTFIGCEVCKKEVRKANKALKKAKEIVEAEEPAVLS